MFNVIKRDGEVAAFQLSKITPVSYTHLTLPTIA